MASARRAEERKMSRPVVPTKTVLETADQIKEAIADTCAIMDTFGLAEGFGHVSSRLPGTPNFIVTPRKAPSLIRKEELLTVDPDWSVIEGSGTPLGERYLHLTIYDRRPDVGAICRFYSETTSILGVLNRPVKVTHGLGYLLGLEIPVFNIAGLHVKPEISEKMVEVLGDSYGIILRGCGAVTVGTNLIEACVRAIFLEQSARIQYRASLLGEPIYMSLEEIDTWNEWYWNRTGYDVFWRAWEYYRSKIKRE